MENPFGNIDWGRVGDWFSEQGVWVLVTLVVAILAYVVVRRLVPRVTASMAGRLMQSRSKKEQEQLSDAVTRVAVWGVMVFGSRLSSPWRSPLIRLRRG